MYKAETRKGPCLRKVLLLDSSGVESWPDAEAGPSHHILRVFYQIRPPHSLLKEVKAPVKPSYDPVELPPLCPGFTPVRSGTGVLDVSNNLNTRELHPPSVFHH